MAAVRAGHRVALAQGAARTDGHRLLSLIEMGRAAHEVLEKQSLNLVLEEADLEHPPVQIDERLTLSCLDLVRYGHA
jgi:hypothetical protein